MATDLGALLKSLDFGRGEGLVEFNISLYWFDTEHIDFLVLGFHESYSPATQSRWIKLSRFQTVYCMFCSIKTIIEYVKLMSMAFLIDADFFQGTKLFIFSVFLNLFLIEFSNRLKSFITLFSEQTSQIYGQRWVDDKPFFLLISPITL